MELKDFTNHSGGAEGADRAWDIIGRKYGFETHIHWRPEHLGNLTPEGRQNMIRDFHNAAKYLGRPSIFRNMELAQRNWFQVHHSEAIYAVARIIAPGDYDGTPTVHFKNETDHENVSGGTGWAVAMAILAGKPVYVFNMFDSQWYTWEPVNGVFILYGGTPTLTEAYAGIGSRAINKMGLAAIEEVYKKTKEKCLTSGIQKPVQE